MQLKIGVIGLYLLAMFFGMGLLSALVDDGDITFTAFGFVSFGIGVISMILLMMVLDYTHPGGKHDPS
jgi:hypothetical protein